MGKKLNPGNGGGRGKKKVVHHSKDAGSKRRIRAARGSLMGKL